MADERNRDDRRSGIEPEAEDAPAATSARWPAVEGELDRALAVVRFLREHCSWDASRTPLSLIPHLQEEAHEVADAIRAEDPGALEDELGDLLLNVAFQVVLGEEAGTFDAASIARRLEEKMERRHPHIFGEGEREDWEAMKARERRGAEGRGPDVAEERARGAEGALQGLPDGLEPLLRAHRIQERVSGVGFDWSEPMGAWEKVDEELDEVRDALQRVSRARDDVRRDALEEEVQEELGDLLFAVVNLARLAGSHASTVLHGANEKFARRFARLEGLAREREIDMEDASLEALDALWDELKEEEGGGER